MLPAELSKALSIELRPLAAGLGAFLVTAVFTPLVIRLAHRMGWVARPTEDRWHERPTALMGGVAIYLGVVTAWIVLPGGVRAWPLVGGATILFAAGVADDLRGLSPVAKLVAQVAGASVVLLAGYRLAPGWPYWLSVAITYLWVIGITNAVNLLDNMDGLAAGIVAIAALTIAALAAVAGGWSDAGPALAVAGAAGAFLIYNRQPARIFMGDGGSLFLGFSVAALAVSHPGAGASGTAAVLAVPAAVMAVPILDTTLVTVKRIASGRRVTQGGRDHSSHRLVFLGLSEGRAVATLYVVAGLFSLLAIGLQLFNVYLTLAVAALAVVALAVFGVFLADVHVEYPHDGNGPDAAEGRAPTLRDEEGSERVVLGAVMRNKREIAGLVADLLIVLGSFVVAHYLRFESGVSDAHLERMLTLLPAVVVIKISALYAFGSYRDLLRYAGSHELIKVVKASTVASGLLIVGLVVATRFEGYSRAVFIIDWLLTTVSLAAVRGAFRGLRGYFASRRRGGRRVLLYGAGDAGYLALREIRQNPDLDLEPVGFVDDDPDKQGRVVHGLPVVGGGDEMADVIRARDVAEVLITISGLPPESRRRIQDQCERQGISSRLMRIDFLPVSAFEDATRDQSERERESTG